MSSLKNTFYQINIIIWVVYHMCLSGGLAWVSINTRQREQLASLRWLFLYFSFRTGNCIIFHEYIFFVFL